MLTARGLPSNDSDLFALMRKRVGACVLAEKGQGLIRSIDTGRPLLAWELNR